MEDKKSNIKHFKGFSVIEGDIKVDINLDRFSEQFKKAQHYLDSAVMNSMEPFMPKRDGTFINETKARSAAIAGTGTVVAGISPHGRFLYHGKVMVDPDTNSPWAKAGAKKVTTKKDLDFAKDKNPKATAFWFDAAKEKDGETWIRETKKRAGGG